MAEKKPLALYDGEVKRLQPGDTLPGAGASADFDKIVVARSTCEVMIFRSNCTVVFFDS